MNSIYIRLIIATALGGFMLMTGFAAQSADQVYQSGPESLALSSWSIVAGPVSSYTRQVTTSSQGTEPIPLTWSISGRVDQPQVLKGAPVSPGLSFLRPERSIIVPPDPAVPAWQRDYENLDSNDLVVLFFEGDRAQPKITPLPSGKGSRDLVSLIREIVPIQAIQKPDERTDAWLKYLAATGSNEGRKVALRSLLGLQAPWPKLAPPLEFLMGGARVDADMRAYIFGCVTFAVMKEKFGPQQLDATEFLGRQLIAEGNPQITLQYVLNLKLLLRFTSEASQAATRAPLQARIADALKRRAARGLTPEVSEQYKQIQAAYPGLI
jgi:hypothetical protein